MRSLAICLPPNAILKQRAKEGLHQLAYLTGYSTRKALAQRCVRILMFHEVGGAGYPLPQFERQLGYLTRNFAVCSLGEAVSRLQDSSVCGNEMVLTFDDGLESHATSVYPILQQRGLPATFFVCPGLIDSGQGIWTLETRARVSKLTAAGLDLWRQQVGAPEGADAELTMQWLKGLPVPIRQSAISRLGESVHAGGLGERQQPARPLLSWGQLHGLDPHLITIGSHSLTHPMLPLLETAELEREVGDSQDLLEKRIGRPCRFFCYPDGAHDTRVVEVTRRRYDAALATIEGVCTAGDDPFTLRRIPAARSLPLLAWRLFRPGA